MKTDNRWSDLHQRTLGALEEAIQSAISDDKSGSVTGMAAFVVGEALRVLRPKVKAALADRTEEEVGQILQALIEKVGRVLHGDPVADGSSRDDHRRDG